MTPMGLQAALAIQNIGTGHSFEITYRLMHSSSEYIDSVGVFSFETYFCSY